MRLRTICAAAVLAAAGCGDDGTGSDPVNCTEASAVEIGAGTVTLAGTSFTPACVRVRRGGTVRFVAADVPHTVTTDGGQTLGGAPIFFDSGDLPVGQPFTSPPFAATGTVRVHCAQHLANGMRATIVVTP